jgi:hypothetical protein
MKTEKVASISEMKNWDGRASVRSSSHSYGFPTNIGEELKQKDWFLRSALPFMTHPAILDAGENSIKRFLARYLIFFLDYTASLEHKIVNRSVEIIVHDELDLDIPYGLKKAGFQLYTDEGYHALIAASVAEDVNIFYGFESRCAPIKRINNLQQLIQLDPEKSKLASLIVGFVSETSITQELLEVASKSLVSPAYNMLRDHLMDECKHSKYFSTLFNFVWCCLSDGLKDFTADFLIKVMFEFFRMDEEWLINNLLEEGVDLGAILDINFERQTKSSHISRAKSGSRATIEALNKIGFFGYKNNYKLFRKVGLIDG